MPVELDKVLAAYGLSQQQVEPIDHGLINQTFVVGPSDAKRYILQRIHPVFEKGIHANFEAVSLHLTNKGLVTPSIVKTDSNELYLTHGGEIWRMQTHIDGVVYNSISQQQLAFLAGALLGKFHVALMDLDLPSQHQRTIKTIDDYLTQLQYTLASHPGHPFFEQAKALAQAIEEFYTLRQEAVQNLDLSATQIVHGDPKINNVLFDAHDQHGVCMIDLDTIHVGSLVNELADAMRSWCNPRGEDTEFTQFEPELFTASMRGYVSQGVIARDQYEDVIVATVLIALTLATRFCIDICEESYFGWDEQKFDSRAHHNYVRAQGQLNLAKCVYQNEACLMQARDSIFSQRRGTSGV